MLLSGSTLILLPQPHAVTMSFDLLRTDSNLGGGGDVFREAERVAAKFIFSNYRV